MSSLRALFEVIGERGLFCSLYADRASHYWHTPEAGQGGQGQPDPRWDARFAPGIELIAAIARGQGAVRAHVRHLASACRRNSGRHQPRPTASSRKLPQHNARFAVTPEAEGSAFVPFAGALDVILCVQEERTVSNDNTVRYRLLQLPAAPSTPLRPRSGCTSIPMARWPSSTAPDVWRATKPTASPSTPQPGRPREPLRRDRPKPCGQVDSRSAPDHFPTGPATTTEAVNSYGT